MESSLIKNRLIKCLLDKRKLLEVVAKPILLLLLIKLISLEVGTFRVFEFPALLIIIGLPFAYLIRKHLKLTCQFQWYVTAAAISLILVPFVFVVFGFLNINFVFVFSVVFLYLLALSSCVLLIMIGNNQEIEELGFFTSDKYLDLLGISLISLVIIKFTLNNFSHTFPGWDTFNFWGLDANYIFEFNKLRNAAFTVTGDISYTSLFPVMYSIIYDFFGKIVEQYATWLNIFILAVGSLQVYFYIERKTLFVKLLGLLLILAVMSASSSAAFLFYFYADVYCAFLLLQYAIFLSNNLPNSTKSYGTRILLIFLPLIALGFVKTGYFALSLCFAFVFFIYDISFIRKHIKKIVISKSFILSLSLLLMLIILRMRYYFPFPKQTNSNILLTSDMAFPTINKMIAHIGSIATFFADKSPIIPTLWCLVIISVIIAIASRRIKRTGLYISGITALGFLIFVGGYIVSLADMVSSSLDRYTTIIMFVMLLTIQFIDYRTSNKHLAKIVNFICYLGLALIALLAFRDIARQLPFKLSSGTYSENGLKEYYELTNKVIEHTGKDARILIADDFSDRTSVTNMLTPAIYSRYYLMNNSVGGQYSFLPYSKLMEFAINNSADYIFLLSYDSLFSGCTNDLIKGEDYLIRLSDLESVNSDICVNLTDAALPLQ